VGDGQAASTGFLFLGRVFSRVECGGLLPHVWWPIRPRGWAGKRLSVRLLLLCELGMATASQSRIMAADGAARLAQRLCEAVVRERVVPHFVDSYVVEHGRYGLQVHAALYKDLLALLQREALLAMAVKTMEIVRVGDPSGGVAKPLAASRRDAMAFRQKFVSAITRQQKWNAGDALQFQTDLQMYEDIVARAANTGRRRKAFEVANHPFVDRCGFVLDSSFIEKARVAASKVLGEIELLVLTIVKGMLNEAAEKSAAPSAQSSGKSGDILDTNSPAFVKKKNKR
jgi:hypothetical protein